MNDQVTFQSGALLEALGHIISGSLSGEFYCPQGSETATFLVSRGNIASVGASTIQSLLFPFLKRNGIDVSTVMPGEPSPALLASIMAIHSDIALFIRRILQGCLRLTPGQTVCFNEIPIEPSLQNVILFNLSDYAMELLNALDRDLVLKLLPSSRARIFTTENYPHRIKTLALNPQQGYILSRIMDGMSVDELLAASGLSEELVLSTIYTLSFFGLIALKEKEESRPQPSHHSAMETPRPRPATSGPTIDELLMQTEDPNKSASSGVQDNIEKAVAFESPQPSPAAKTIDGILRMNSDQTKSSPTAPSVPVDLLAEIDDLIILAGLNNYYNLLGVDFHASPDDLRRQFVSMTKKFHPDKFQQYHDSETISKVNQIFAKITEAWDTLKDPTQRLSYNERIQAEASRSSVKGAPSKAETSNKKDPPPMAYEDREHRAKQHFLHGKEQFKQKKYHEAMEHFRETVRMMPTVPEYQFMLGKTLAMNPQRTKEAEERLKLAYEARPDRFEFVQELARFYQRIQLQHRAKRFYEMVLKLDPDNDEALFMLGRPRKKKASKTQPRNLKDLLKMDFKDIFKSDSD